MPAPYALTNAETEIWERITASMPADHFSPGNAPVFAQLCRHIAASDKVAMLVEMITKKKPFNPDHFSTMLRSQVAESVVINRLARSMRLTQQSLYRGELVRNRPINTSPDVKNCRLAPTTKSGTCMQTMWCCVVIYRTGRRAASSVSERMAVTCRMPQRFA